MADSVVELALRIPVDAAQIAPAAAQLRAMASAEEQVTQSSTAAAGSMQMLTYQLFQAGQGIALGLSPMQVLTQQGGQIALAMKSAGVGLADVAALAGPVAIGLAGTAAVVTGLYGDWLLLTGSEEDNSQTTAEVGAAYVKLQAIVSDTHSKVIDLEAAMGAITETQAKMAHAADDAFAHYQKATEDTRTRMGELRTEQASVTTQLVDMAESVVPEWTPFGMALRSVTRDTAEYQGELDSLQGTVDTAIKATRENVFATDELIKAKEKEKESHGSNADAVRAETAAQRLAAQYAREVQAAFTAQAKADAMLKAAAAYNDPLQQENDRWEVYKGQLEDAARLTSDQTLAVKALQKAQEEHLDTIQRINDAQEKANTFQGSAGGSAYQGVYNATDAVNTIGGGANGLLSALGSSGPYGGLISSILSLVEKLDETLDGIYDFIDKVLDQIGRLPETVTGFITKLITDLPKSVGDALGELLGSLPRVVGELITQLVDPRTWLEVGKDIVQGFIQGFTTGSGGKSGVGETALSLLSGGLYGLVKGSHADGAYIAQTGLYRLHEGETVWNEARTNAAAQGGAGGPLRGSLTAMGGQFHVLIDAASLSDAMDHARRQGFSMGVAV